MSWNSGEPCLAYRQEQGINIFTTTSRLNLGPTQPPVKCVSGIIAPGLQRWSSIIFYRHKIYLKLAQKQEFQGTRKDRGSSLRYAGAIKPCNLVDK
jgi:hypothetical protein